MIDLGALVALRAVAMRGSVVGAAETLGFTPSAVSQQIKRLERQTGVPLLERVGRGVILTRHGRHLVDQGGRLLTDLEELEAGLRRQASAVSGRLRLTAFSTAMRGLIAPLARDLAVTYPDLALSLTEREPWETVELVATGQTDLGVVHRWGDVPLAIPEHVAADVVGHDLAEVIVPGGHRLATAAYVTPADLADEAWIATPTHTICREWLHRMYVGTGRVPRIVHECMEFDSQLALVRAGLGVALVPRLGRSPLGDDLVAVPTKDPEPVREIVAVRRCSMVDSPAIRAVVRALIARS
jgi:DNA-binding transcriptional LysR family regulator